MASVCTCMFRERLTLSPLSLTIRTYPTSRTPINSLADRPTGLFSYKTLILSGTFSLTPNSLLLTLSPTTIKLTSPPTILTLLLSWNLQLSVLLTLPLPVTSNHLPQRTPLYFVPSRTCLMTPPFSHIPHLLTGLLTMDTYIIRDACMYVPPPARSSLLHSIHSSPLSGHLRRFRTKAVVERDFWWLGLSVFINNFVAGCAVCQQNKAHMHPVIPPLSPIHSSSSLPFKQLSVDLITDLLLSHGHDSLMVVVNHGLTKRVILAPCSKTVDANGIAQLFFDHVFKRFGLHNTLISDRGPQFASAFTRELARILKYDVHLSTAYPQANGQIK